MNKEQLYRTIRDYCAENSDPVIVTKYSRYFKDGYDAWGLQSGLVTERANEISEDTSITLDLVLDTAPLLLKSGKYEETSFAILLLCSFKKQFDLRIFNEFEKWYSIGIVNWAHADYICSEVFPLFYKKGIITYEILAPWRFSEFRFKRRTVPVSMIKLLKTTDDYQPYLDFLDPMMTDTERVVHQGLGWFLREAWKKQPDQTEKLLFKWKNTAARLIFQYATEKMDKAGRERFRREKA